MIMTGTANNIETALALATSGFFVFPCHSGGDKAKQPMPFIKWRDVSSSDERQIRQWWQKWPGAAVGLDLAKSGLIVIDADRHGEHDGVLAIGDLMNSIGYEPHGVPLAATPNEGTHFFYRQPAGKKFGNGKGSLPAGVDVRGHGGYVIAPGTVMQDGRLYEVFGDIAEAPELPAWLSALLDVAPAVAERAAVVPVSRTEHSDARIQAYCDAAIKAETDKARSAPSGQRNNTLNEAAFALGQLVGAGWVTEGEIFALLMNAASQSGLGEVESRKTIQSGIRAGFRDPRVLPDSEYGSVDPVEAATAARRLIEAHDGTLADAETGEIVETILPVSKPEPLPYPAGLVGTMAKWIVTTARRPQPELAIGAALAVIGTLAGRQFQGPTESATHLYVLGIAPTGTGKDHALQQIGRLMAAAKLGHHLGPSEFISMPAVVNFLVRKPLSICAMDEFGSFMKRINGRNASGFESAISKVIRTMWSSSFAPYATPEWAQKASEMIQSPAITLYGASTPEQFYSAMEGASLEDGTLNRFLLINGRGNIGEVEPEHDKSIVPDGIAADMGLIYYRSGMMASTYRNDPHADPAGAGQLRKLPWCADGSHKRYMAFSEEMQHRVSRDPDNGAFYARSAEMAVRIATIIAIGRLDDDQVRMADLEYGIMIAQRSAEMMQAGANDYMASNENQANAQKIMRAVRTRGGRCKYRDLVQSLKNSVKARDLRDILQSLCDGEQLEKQVVKPPNGGKELIWYQVQN